MARRPKVLLTRRFTFSASHRLHAPELSADENRALFGKCNRESGHGHNYGVEVSLLGPLDPRTGMVFSLTELKTVIEETIEAELDHRHLNSDVAAFRTLNPTVENIAVIIWDMLQKRLPAGLLHEVKVSETENNAAIYRSEN
jgi:6-pyruvoyltetrahydropterin/6-carboxytetrahydropterin synthase